MSDFFDDVARRVAEPMPRRRAIRIVLGAAVGVAVGTRQVPTALAITCPPPQYHCDCPSINGLFYRWCCGPNQDCKCTPPPNGGAYCECKPSQKCGSACCDVGDKCGDPKTGRCCKPHEVPCGETCCAPGTECANADIGYCCGPRQ